MLEYPQIHLARQDSSQSTEGASRTYSRTPLDHLPKVWESGQVPADRKIASVIPIYRKSRREELRELQTVSLAWVPGKIVKIFLGTVGRSLRNNAAIRHRQHGFTKLKSCIANLILFDKVTHVVVKGKEWV